MPTKRTGKSSRRIRADGIAIHLCGRPASRDRDLYEYHHRVAGLIEILNQCMPPFVVAVEGEWGRGKSSFLNMVQDELALSGKPKWTVVPYNPWRYSIESFEDAWESMVETITHPSHNLPKGKRDSLTGLVAQNRLVRLLLDAAVPVSNFFVPGAEKVLKSVKTGAAALQKYLASSDGLGRRYAIFDDVRAKLHTLCPDPNQRVLLLVDDLDRCQPSTVVHVFRSIATLFAPIEDSGPNFVVLLGFDRRAATRALMRDQNWELEDASGYLDKIVNLHVTLPILEFGSGDKKRAAENIYHAVADGGQRRTRAVSGAREYRFKLPRDRVEVIQRYMRFNPRELERFCILFDLKWSTRFKANRDSAGSRSRSKKWIDRFRDRLIVETIIERRWPLYDSKTAVQERNREAIQHAIAGKPLDAAGLPCEDYIADTEFLEIHSIHSSWEGSTSHAARRKPK